MRGRQVPALVFCCALLASLVMAAGAFAGRLQHARLNPASGCSVAQTAHCTVQPYVATADEAAVRKVVDAYFTLQHESRLAGSTLDLGVVVDKASEEGRALLDYELGRLRYFLFCWQDQGVTITAYNYRPVYEGIQVDGDTAVVHVRPWVDLQYADIADHLEAYYGDLHVITLVRGPAGWRIIADDYDNEWKELWPVGTDFAALQATYHERIAETEAREAELQRQHGGRKEERGGTE